jgi:tetratricopeptide (TPR) repeat protein
MAETPDNQFWNYIAHGKFLDAAKRGDTIGSTNPHYHLLSSFSYMMLNDNSGSDEQYNLFIEKGSDYPPEDFEKEFEEILDDYKNSYVYAYIGAFIWQFRNIFNINGEELLYDALELDRNNYIANNYVSMFEYNNGNIEKSLNYALLSIDNSENYSEPYVNAANSYESMGNKDEAIEILFRALEECREPHYNAYLSLFYKLGQSGSGIVQQFNQTLMAEIIHIEEESLDIFYERLKSLPYIFYALLENLIDKGCYSEAHYLLSRASELDIEKERLLYLEIELYYQSYSQNSFNEAVKNYLDLIHTDSETVASIAHMALQFGFFEGAVELYSEFIEMERDMNPYRLMTSYSNLGTAYAELDNFDEAYKNWNLALELVPDDEITLANIKKYSSEMKE